MRAEAALAIVLAASGCAVEPSVPGAFSFAVMGDTPYNAAEERAFERMITEVNAEDVAFVVHVGDIKGGGACSDALYAKRRAEFDASTHPFIYTPGDNEWTECTDVTGRPIALERLARIRSVFFAGHESLGQNRIATDAQDECLAPAVAGCGCGALPENRTWTHAGIAFVTLNIVGEHDGRGIDAENDKAADCRAEGNRRWLERAAQRTIAQDLRALVVLIQADPWFSKRRVFDPFLADLERTARLIRRPLLFVHGDTHSYKVDYPFEGVTRLETWGSPFVGWIKVTVAPARSAMFRFDSRLVAIPLRPSAPPVP